MLLLFQLPPLRSLVQLRLASWGRCCCQRRPPIRPLSQALTCYRSPFRWEIQISLPLSPLILSFSFPPPALPLSSSFPSLLPPSPFPISPAFSLSSPSTPLCSLPLPALLPLPIPPPPPRCHLSWPHVLGPQTGCFNAPRGSGRKGMEEGFFTAGLKGHLCRKALLDAARWDWAHSPHGSHHPEIHPSVRGPCSSVCMPLSYRTGLPPDHLCSLSA